MRIRLLALSLILTFVPQRGLQAADRDLARSPEYKWHQVETSKEVSSFPVIGQVIAEEGALHFQTARISGRVLSLVNEEGSLVKKGAPLFHVTGPECISIREEKRIAHKSNLKELIDTVMQRQRELNIQVTDSSCVITSDSDGVLVKRTANSGSAFNQGDALAHVLESSKMRVEIEVPEKSASLISKGTEVNFRIPSLNDFKGKSTVQQVFPLVEESTRIMKARLLKTQLPAGTKLNSMVFADVSLSSGKACFTIPSTAVTLQDGNSWVLVRRGGVIARVSVHMLSNQEDNILVNPLVSGALKAGDVIATFNVPFLYREIKQLEAKK